MWSSFAFALLCATSAAQGTTLLELDTKKLDLENKNFYEWTGPMLEVKVSGYASKFEAGGTVAWEMQGSGADEQLVVYETQHVNIYGDFPADYNG